MEVIRNKREIVIRVSADIGLRDLQSMLNYIRLRELSARSKKVKQSTIDKLAKNVNSNWWKRNRKRFVDEGGS